MLFAIYLTKMKKTAFKVYLTTAQGNNNFSSQARNRTNQILNSKAFKTKHLGIIGKVLNFISRIYNDTLGKIFSFIGSIFHSAGSTIESKLGPNYSIILLGLIAVLIGISLFIILRRRQNIGSKNSDLVVEHDFERIDDIATLKKLAEDAELDSKFNLAARIHFRICLMKLQNAGIIGSHEIKTLGMLNNQLDSSDFFALTSIIEKIVYFTYNLDESNYRSFKEQLYKTVEFILKNYKPQKEEFEFSDIKELVSKL
jgi:hypothetical protein